MGGLSKNVYRILNAEKLRAEHQAKKRARKNGQGFVEEREMEAPPKKPKKGKEKAVVDSAPEEELRLMPGEKLGDFNRSVVLH